MAVNRLDEGIVIAVAGKTKAGKSTLLNALIDEVDMRPTGQTCVTTTISGKSVCIIETRDGQELRTTRLDLLIFCIPVGLGLKFEHTNPQIMRNLQAKCGADIWKHCVVVLTLSQHARKRLSDAYQDQTESKEKYISFIREYADEVRRELRTNLRINNMDVKTVFDWEAEALSDEHVIPVVPAGDELDDSVLPGVTIDKSTWGWKEEILFLMSVKASNRLGFKEILLKKAISSGRFIPCVLTHLTESTEVDHQEQSEITPLIIKLECRHYPDGLFGNLISQLLVSNLDERDHSVKFTLVPEKLFKDQVSLEVYSPGVVDEVCMKLLPADSGSGRKYIEIGYLPDDATDRGTPKRIACNNVRQQIHAAILRSRDHLHSSVEPVECMRCGTCNSLHEVQESGQYHRTRCRSARTFDRIPPQGRCWYNEDSIPEDTIDAPQTPLTVANQAFVMQCLSPLGNPELIQLGVVLGLSHARLHRMAPESLCGDMVHAWLIKDGNVTDPTLEGLVDALIDCDHTGVASDIQRKRMRLQRNH